MISEPPNAADSSRRESTQPISGITALGFGFLYASAYFLPTIAGRSAYFLPSRHVFRLVAWPTLIAALIVAVLVCAASFASRRWLNRRVAALAKHMTLAILSWIGLKGVIEVCGYRWQELLPGLNISLTNQRMLKFGIIIALFVLIAGTGRVARRADRALASLGFAFAAVGLFRLLALWNGLSVNSIMPMAAPSVGSVAAEVVPVPRSRRVVWVIFDETDFDRVYGADAPRQGELPNFTALAERSVFATHANSPASDTIYSIPALLTGRAVGAGGGQIDRTASLWLRDAAGGSTAFTEANSIFGTLAANGQASSVLGFYHPYCRLFQLARCDSLANPEIGHANAALLANVPDTILFSLSEQNQWEQVTSTLLALLPAYLARDDALTFVHLNVPHPPAQYADKRLGLASSNDFLTEYSHNLLFADQILGGIVRQLQEQSNRHEILLVVSSDHWLRNMWYRPELPEVSHRIPFMAWKVGDTQRYILSQPVSTVHSAEMIRQYLNGSLTTQADIARWWSRQIAFPSYVRPPK